MKRLIWLLSLSILAACGGGGGSDDGGDTGGDNGGNTGGDATVERVSLTGLAVKGLARAAKVEAFITQGASFKSTPDAVALTNSKGKYTLRLPEELESYEGPVKVVLSYNDENSQLQCDDTAGCGETAAYGEFYAMPEDFELKSVVSVGSGAETISGDTIVNISALTTLATDFLESQETISETTIKQSNNQIRAVFALPSGVDLIATEPQVVAPGAQENGDAIYGAINAAFQKIANTASESNPGAELINILDDFSAQLVENDGQIFLKAADQSGDLSLGDVTQAALDLNVLEGDDLTSVQTTDTTADNADAGTITNINPPSITAGADQTVNSGEPVNIATSFLAGESAATNAVYLWQVISGPLNLSGVTTNQSSLTFTAPEQGGVITLRVIIEADSGADNDIVKVTVNPVLATDTSDSGAYLFTGVQTVLGGGGDSLQLEGELWTEDLNLTFNSNGTASISGSANRSFDTWEASQSFGQANAINLFVRTYESGNEPDTFSLPATQLANGSVKLPIPAEIEENDDGGGNVNERSYTDPYEVNFVKLADGLYASTLLYFAEDYNVVNGSDEADPFRSEMKTELVTLNKNNSFSSFSALANKSYVGVVIREEVDNGPNFSYVVQKEVLSFDGTGANYSAYQVGARSDVMMNSDIPTGFSTNTTYYSTFDTTGTPETFATSEFTISGNGFNIGLDTTDSGGLVSANISEDLSAMTISNLEYSNNSGSVFTDGTPTANSYVKGIFFEANPGVQLDGKTFSFTGINYLNEHIDAVASRAPETVLETYKGTISFSGAVATINFETVNGRVYHNTQTVQDPVDVTVELDRTSESGSVQVTFTSSVADELGCVQESAGTLEFCVSVNGTIIGHDEQISSDGDHEDVSLHRFFGKQLSDTNSQVAHFLPSALEGNTYLGTFNDGGTEGTGLYNFTDGTNGNVEWDDNPGVQEAFTWLVDANGALVVTLSGGEVDTYTLLEGNQNKGGIEFKIDGVLQDSGAAQSWERQYP